MRTYLIALYFLAVPVAEATYVVTYDLWIPQADGSEYRAVRESDHSRYTAVVIFPDYFANYFGPQDRLSTLMLRGHFREGDSAIDEYLLKITGHYYQSVLNHARGTPADRERAQALVQRRRAKEPATDGRSAFVFITEHGNIFEPLAQLRVAGRDKDGFLGSDRSFFEKGLTGPYPSDAPPFPYLRVPRMLPEDGRLDVFRVADLDTLPSVEIHSEVKDSVEMKNYRMDPRTLRRFLPYLQRIAGMHRLYYFGSQKQDGQGMAVRTIWAEAMGDELRNIYQRMMGFDVWKTLNSEHTGFQNCHLMRTDIPRMEARITELLVRDEFGQARSDRPQWLIYKPEYIKAISQCNGLLVSQ